MTVDMEQPMLIPLCKILQLMWELAPTSTLIPAWLCLWHWKPCSLHAQGECGEGDFGILSYTSQKCVGRRVLVGPCPLRLKSGVMGMLPEETLLPPYWRKMEAWGLTCPVGASHQEWGCRDQLGAICTMVTLSLITAYPHKCLCIWKVIVDTPFGGSNKE